MFTCVIINRQYWLGRNPLRNSHAYEWPRAVIRTQKPGRICHVTDAWSAIDVRVRTTRESYLVQRSKRTPPSPLLSQTVHHVSTAQPPHFGPPCPSRGLEKEHLPEPPFKHAQTCRQSLAPLQDTL